METVDLIRTNILAFCKYINRDFKIGQHHYRIAKRLNDIARGIPTRVIIAMPPRHGKSYLCSQHFPAFYMGKNPSNNVILTGYAQSLVEDFGTYNRNLLLHPSYQEIFETRLDDSVTAKKRFSTKQDGHFYAVGRGGAITGRGGDLIIVDDLFKNDQEAQSGHIRHQLQEWWKNTLRTRLMPNGSIIIINTRWHHEDLIGFVMENSKENWEYIKMDAISPSGDALWPEMWPIDELENIKREIGSRAFEALYQQEPSIAEGNIIKREWVKRYKEIYRRDDEVITADLSMKGGVRSDNVAIQYWVRQAEKYMYVDGIKGKWDFMETVRVFQDFCAKYPHVGKIKVEDKANGPALYSALREHIPGISMWTPKTSKEGRVNAVSPLYEAGLVEYPETFDGEDEYFRELYEFPYSKHDDQVDATTMALLLLKKTKNTFMIPIGSRDY